jgi:hypothetical protein
LSKSKLTTPVYKLVGRRRGGYLALKMDMIGISTLPSKDFDVREQDLKLMFGLEFEKRTLTLLFQVCKRNRGPR